MNIAAIHRSSGRVKIKAAPRRWEAHRENFARSGVQVYIPASECAKLIYHSFSYWIFICSTWSKLVRTPTWVAPVRLSMTWCRPQALRKTSMHASWSNVMLGEERYGALALMRTYHFPGCALPTAATANKPLEREKKPPKPVFRLCWE